MVEILIRFSGFGVDEGTAQMRLEVDMGEHPRDALNLYIARTPFIAGLSPDANRLIRENAALYAPTSVFGFETATYVNTEGQLHFANWLWDRSVLGDYYRSHNAGYLPVAPDDWTVLVVEGIGGDSSNDAFLIAFLLDRGVNLLVDALVVGALAKGANHAKRWVTDLRAREAASYWADSRGFVAPNQLRQWLDHKSAWTWSEVSERLRISADSAQALLAALGFESDASNTWRMGFSEDARARRQEWIENEIREY